MKEQHLFVLLLLVGIAALVFGLAYRPPAAMPAPRRATLAEARAMRERILAAGAERRRHAWPLLEKVGR